MTTHEAITNAIENMEEMLRVIDTVLKVSVATPGEKQQLGPSRTRWQAALDELKTKEREVRPTAGYRNWEKGQAEASKNYNPPSTKPVA